MPKKLKTILITLGITLLLLSILISLRKIFAPFIIALILAYILNPLVEKLHKLKINRTISSVIFSILTFLIFISIPLLLFPALVEQGKDMVNQAPNFVNYINTHILEVINAKFNMHLHFDLTAIKERLLDKLSTKSKNSVGAIAKNGLMLLEVAIDLVLIPFAMFFALKNWYGIVAYFDKFIPKKYLQITHAVIDDIDKVLSGYLRGQVLVMLVMATIYAVPLSFTKLTSQIVIGMVTGLLVFVPYLPYTIGFFLAVCMALASSASALQLTAVIVIYIIAALLENFVVTPYLIGDKIGVHPIILILTLMIFGEIFGITGIILALPLSAISAVLFGYIKSYYFQTRYYNEV